MEFHTDKPKYQWKNMAESVTKAIKGKYKIRIVQRNRSNRVQYFIMVWEDEIYYHTSGKYGIPYLERLTGDTIDISECMESDFYDLVWFWNNHSDDTK